MQRIVHMEQFQSSLRSSWIKTWSPLVLLQTSVEKPRNKRLSRIIDEIPTDESKIYEHESCVFHLLINDIPDSSIITSLIYLVYMLPEARTKPDHEYVIYAIPVSEEK